MSVHSWSMMRASGGERQNKRCPCLMVASAAGVTLAGLFVWNVWQITKKVRLGSALWSRSWFTNSQNICRGQATSLEIDTMLHDIQSEFHHIQIFRATGPWGLVLTLDNKIMFTKYDGPAQSEMMAHIPSIGHPKPTKALVVGANACGSIVTQLLKHISYDAIHVCELDLEVLSAVKKFFPDTARAYEDARVHVHAMDGFQFLINRKNEFDVILLNCVGPPEVQYREPFFRAVYKALTPDGILVARTRAAWVNAENVSALKALANGIFEKVEYATVTVPSQPCGSIGLLCCTKSSAVAASQPRRGSAVADLSDLDFYTEQLHAASFVLPKFAQLALGQ